MRTDETPIKSNNRWRIEEGLYLLALGIALLMRFVILGRGYLAEHEAGFAWQAFQVAQGDQFRMLSHPAYVLGTGLLFYIFGSGEFAARLLPALAGSAVILYPYVLRSQIGRKAALIAAFGLAFDPILVAISRQAGSPVMALGFIALTLFFYQKRSMVAAGFFAGLALLSGESFVFGMLFVLLGWLFAKFIGGRSLAFSLEGDLRLRGVIGMAMALVIFGTLFMRYPEGLSAMFQAVPDYFSGWLGSDSAAAGAPVLQILAAIPIYQPAALLFGLPGLLGKRTYQQPVFIFLAGGLLGSLILALLDPARQVWMLVWVLVPLWLFAGKVLANFLTLPSLQDRILVAGETIFFLVLMLYWWFNLARMTRLQFVAIPPETGLFDFQALDPNSRVYIVRFIVLVFIPLLILLMTAIARYLWKGMAPLQGAVWGVGLFLLFYLMVVTWNFTAPPEDLAGELWMPGAAPGYPGEVLAAIEEASVQINGSQNGLELVYHIDSPVVHWLLRDFPNARFQPVELQNELPDVVLNSSIESGASNLLNQFYRGQQIPLMLEREWGGGALPHDFDRWLVYREAPVAKYWVVLWTRADAFPLYEAQPEE